MLTATAAYRSALVLPARRETIIRVFHGTDDVTPADGIPLAAGSVTASLNSRVTRTATLTVAPQLYPELVTDLLAPERAELRIFTGIGYSNGSAEVFPVFRGRVADVTQAPDGNVTIRGDDRAADVIAQRFEFPQSSIAGSSTLAEIRRFISQVLPDATFTGEDIDDQPTPDLTWDDDRGRALDELAASLHARWYALGDGSFTTRRLPYADAPAVGRYADGLPDGNGGGLLSEVSRSRSRDGAANSITVISERISDGTTVEATARDMEPASPTFYNGLYGRVTATLRPQTPLALAAAQALAVATLKATTALTDQWSVSMTPDATLEPGDVIDLEWRGARTRQVIDSITYPLTTAGAMALGCRTVSAVQGTDVP